MTSRSLPLKSTESLVMSGFKSKPPNKGILKKNYQARLKSLSLISAVSIKQKHNRTMYSLSSRNLIFKNCFIFNWRIIALQHCVGFCHTTR